MRSKFFDDLFAQGNSLWIKVFGAALATPVVAVWGLGRSMRKNRELELSDSVFITTVVASFLVGGVLGLLLAAKDTVNERMQAGQPVPLVLKLLLGYRMLSLAIWFVLAVFGTFAITMATLTL